jgi:hypothetical protein
MLPLLAADKCGAWRCGDQIGYIDSGHGHHDGLTEVKLKNKAGKYLDSRMAGSTGIQVRYWTGN